MYQRRIYLFIISISIILTLYLMVNFNFKESLVEYETILNQDAFRNKSVKTILFWNSMFGDKRFYYTEDKFEKCPLHKKCISTFNRHIINEENFDAILFHGIIDLSPDDLPKKRSASQRYVFVSLESPTNAKALQFFRNNFFNLTMSYSMNSDVIWPYANIAEKESQSVVAPSVAVKWNTSYEEEHIAEDEIISEIVKRKKNMAIWFRSNCDTKSGRENYVEDLENYMKVDKVGHCKLFSDKECPRQNNCFAKLVEPNYYFYLSFENSFCNDYVTEKFFNALQYYVVPVVYGGANYKHFAPPYSYINALDFESPKELAKYLLQLSENRTEYLKYFRWKRNYVVHQASVTEKTMCDLCYLLHEENGTKIYENISFWYSDNECPIQKKLSYQIKSGGSSYVTKKTLQQS